MAGKAVEKIDGATAPGAHALHHLLDSPGPDAAKQNFFLHSGFPTANTQISDTDTTAAFLSWGKLLGSSSPHHLAASEV